MTYSEWLAIPRPVYRNRWGFIIYPTFILSAAGIAGLSGYFCGVFAGSIFGYGLGSYAMMKAIDVTEYLGGKSWGKIYDKWSKENPIPDFREEWKDVDHSVIVCATIMAFGC